MQIDCKYGKLKKWNFKFTQNADNIQTQEPMNAKPSFKTKELNPLNQTQGSKPRNSNQGIQTHEYQPRNPNPWIQT